MQHFLLVAAVASTLNCISFRLLVVFLSWFYILVSVTLLCITWRLVTLIIKLVIFSGDVEVINGFWVKILFEESDVVFGIWSKMIACISIRVLTISFLVERSFCKMSIFCCKMLCFRLVFYEDNCLWQFLR